MTAVTTHAPAEPASASADGPTRRASFVGASFAVAQRTARKFLRTPQLIVVGTIQGALFLLIFRYVFGGAIDTGGVAYVDFLVPGYVTTSVLFVGMMTAAGVAEDVEQGFFDRLRSLPIPRLSVLTGRALADTGMLTWNLAVTVAIGFAIGFGLTGSAAAGLAAFALCLLFGFAFIWVFVTLGLFAGNAQAAQGMSLLVFPLTFVSSAYVPVTTMPGWLQPFAKYNPITSMVDAVRALCLGDHAHAVLGDGAGHYVVPAVLWSIALVVVFAPIAVARFRRG